MDKDTEEKIKYLQFPVSLLREIHTKPKETITSIFHIGIYNMAKNRVDFYQDKLTAILETIDWYGLKPNEATAVQIIERAEAIKTDSTVMPTVNIKILHRYLEEIDNWYVRKKREKILTLSAYIAVRSIIGTKKQVLTNKSHIGARMFGYSSIKEIPDLGSVDPAIREELYKYVFHEGKQRHHLGKLLNALQLDWYVTIYSHRIKGLLIGNHETTVKELAEYAEKGKLKYRLQQLKKDQEKARNEVLQQLKNV